MNMSFMTSGDPESFDVTLKHACEHAKKLGSVKAEISVGQGQVCERQRCASARAACSEGEGPPAYYNEKELHPLYRFPDTANLSNF